MIRLNKLIADSGLCSRRQADELIAGGHVKVGPLIAIQGMPVAESDIAAVRVNGKPLPVSTKRYLVFHKPTGIITTRKDEKQRETIYDRLPEIYRDLDPVGRLDRESSGLLLLSNDGDFLHRLMHPSHKVEKTYRVTLNKALKKAHAKTLLEGLTLLPEGKLAKVHRLDVTNDPHSYLVVLLTGYNRQIRRSFAQVGYEVTKLKRVGFGPIRLGQLPIGQYRELSPLERRRLGLGDPATPTQPGKGQKQTKQKNRPVKERGHHQGEAKRKQQNKRRPPKV